MEHQKPTDDQLERRYGFRHVPNEKLEKYYQIRKKCGELARVLVANTPCCPEQTRALNALDEAMALSLFAMERHD